MTFEWLLGKSWEILTYPIFTVKGTQITLMTGVTLLLLLWATFWIASRIEKVVAERVLSRMEMDSGMRFTLARIVQYLVVVIGLFVGLQLVGLDLSALAVVAGFLSIGIGFGLQNITSNFISGLIIMFERPIKPGDFVSVGDQKGRVREIRMRSTTIVTTDNVSIVVPNSEFISQPVVNWSLQDSRTRLHIPVDLAYESDPLTVKDVLLEAARSHPLVAADRPPQVWLMEFGENALIFELLVWITDPAEARAVKSAINFAILDGCRRRGLEISFPQRDLHLKSAVPLQVQMPAKS